MLTMHYFILYFQQPYDIGIIVTTLYETDT